MKKIWILGDSFASTTLLKDEWMQQIKDNLKYELFNYALSGSSIPYATYQFAKHRMDIEYEDILIVAVTSLYRKWFIKTFPQVFSFANLNGADVETAKVKAIREYEKHLRNTDEEWAIFDNFIYAVDMITKELNLTTVILPCFVDSQLEFETKDRFKNIHVAKGNLIEVSFNEFTPSIEKTIRNQQMVGRFNEARANHLLRSNHTILSNKILDYIKNKDAIDLTVGFQQHIIDENFFNKTQPEIWGNIWQL